MAVRRHAGKIVADTLGVSRQDLRAALKGGQSVAEYAAVPDKNPDAVQTRSSTRRTPRSTRPSPTVASTQARAEEIKGKVAARVEKVMNRTSGRAERRKSRADALRSEPGSPDAHRVPVSRTCPPAPPAGTFASWTRTRLLTMSRYLLILSPCPVAGAGTLLPIEQSILVAGLAAGRGGQPRVPRLRPRVGDPGAGGGAPADRPRHAVPRARRAWRGRAAHQPLGGRRPRRRRRRPRRRLYRVTGLGEAALADADRANAARHERADRGLASS